MSLTEEMTDFCQKGVIPRMLHDYICVKVLKEEKIGSIFLSNPADYTDPMKTHGELIKQDVLRGEVLAVGPGKKTKKGVRISCDLKRGDIVRFESTMGQPLPNAKDVLVMSERAVMAVES